MLKIENGRFIENTRVDNASFEKPITNPVVSQKTPLRVLITSASKKAPLIHAMKNAVTKYRASSLVIAGDSDPSALAAYVADVFWCMPPLEALSIDTFDTLLADILQQGIDIILPTRDAELLFWAKNKNRFAEKGIAVLISQASSIQLCIDKLAFARFGIKKHLPFIPAYMSIDEASTTHPGRWVVKERFGAGSKGLALNLSVEAAIKHADTLQSPLFQPHIEGIEISIDAWLDKDNAVKGLVLRKREIIINGESQITTTFKDEMIERIATQCLEQLKLSGPVVMQAFLDQEGHLQVIECNARFGGASTASIALGLDSLYWSITEAMEGTVEDISFHRKPHELKQIRIPSDIYVHCHRI